MKSTTTVVSKDSSLVVYTTTNIQSVSYYQTTLFFQIFFCFDFQTPSEAEERIYYSVFKSKEEAAVGANKTCAIEMTFILTIYLV